MKRLTFTAVVLVSTMQLAAGLESSKSGLDALVDADLAVQMVRACYDLKAAWGKTQSQHLNFDATVKEMKPHYQAVRRIADAMSTRSGNTPLQKIRTLANGDTGEMLEACTMAADYKNLPGRPMMDYHSGLRKHIR